MLRKWLRALWLTTVAQKEKPPVLADFPSMVIFLFCARNFVLRKINSSEEEKFN